MLALMLRLDELKRTARAGWNKEFPAGGKYKTRCVQEAESTADHSWGLAMFAMMMAPRLGVDPYKVVCMALVHDIAELVTGDIVTATLSGEEKMLAEREKRLAEETAMREIFRPMGDWGRTCLDLWIQYADQSTPEARALHQLDKLEACIQAMAYRREGQELNPIEFFDYTERFLTAPECREILALLRSNANA